MQEHDESKSRNGWANVKRAFGYGVAICCTLLIVGYVCICFSIRSSVKEIGATAVSQYPGDRVEALMKYVDSKNHSLEKRNRAVWALGQIGDERALTMLEKFHTSQPCDHSSTLCQREVGKAIKACKGAFNATAWLPR